MNSTDTPTPRIDADHVNDHVTDHACPFCGADSIPSYTGYPNITGVAIFKERKCGSVIDRYYPEKETRTELCREREKSQKLEAEVERLKANLRRAVEIAEILSPSCCDEEHCMDRCEVCTPLRAELNQLNSTLNPDKK